MIAQQASHGQIYWMLSAEASMSQEASVILDDLCECHIDMHKCHRAMQKNQQDFERFVILELKLNGPCSITMASLP